MSWNLDVDCEPKLLLSSTLFSIFIRRDGPAPEITPHKRNKLEIESPYLQKLSHSNLINVSGHRPLSSTMSKNQRIFESSSHQKAITNRPSSANADKYEAYRQNSYRFLNYSDRTDAPNQNINNKAQFKNVSIRGQRPSSAPGNRFVVIFG